MAEALSVAAHSAAEGAEASPAAEVLSAAEALHAVFNL